MKKHRTALSAGVALVLVFFAMATRGELPIGERIKEARNAGSVTNLTAIYDEIESLWPENSKIYFQNQNQLGEALEILSPTNSAARQLLERQSASVLGKPLATNNLAADSYFSAKEATLRRLVRIPKLTPALRTAQEIATTIGEAQAAVISNYVPVQVTMNVAPPVLPTAPLKSNQYIVTMSGMSPDAIEDPVAREAYKKAIADNELGKAQNNLQRNLPDMINDMKTSFRQYCHALFWQDPGAKNEIDELAKLAHLTEKEKNDLAK
jgi:hypothetical protein